MPRCPSRGSSSAALRWARCWAWRLPRALSPAFADHFSLPFLLGLVALATVLVVVCRFLWVLAMELVHRGRGTPVLRDALILTIAGPKGAVTLSIIFLIPRTLADGSAFPERDLLIFLTASVILCTLLLADGLLPRLAPRRREDGEASATELRRGTIKVLEGTLRELRAMLQNDDDPQLEPALRQTIASCRLRLNRERGALDDSCSRQMDELQAEVRQRQQQKADAIGGEAYGGESPRERASFYAMLRAVRRSVGYSGTDVKVGTRFGGLLGRVALLWQGAKPLEVEGDEAERLYYDACLFAIELEHGAIDFLEEAATDEGRQRAARLLLDEHKTALNSLWNRINYGQDVKQADHTGLTLVHHDGLPAGMRPLFGKQLLEAARYADEVDADALTIELDQIRRLQEDGAISESVAQQLRQRVYVLQITLGD